MYMRSKIQIEGMWIVVDDSSTPSVEFRCKDITLPSVDGPDTLAKSFALIVYAFGEQPISAIVLLEAYPVLCPSGALFLDGQDKTLTALLNSSGLFLILPPRLMLVANDRIRLSHHGAKYAESVHDRGFSRITLGGGVPSSRFSDFRLD